MHNHSTQNTASHKNDGKDSKFKWTDSILASIAVLIISVMVVFVFNTDVLLAVLNLKPVNDSSIDESIQRAYYVAEVVEVYETIPIEGEEVNYEDVASAVVMIKTGNLKGEELTIPLSYADKTLVSIDGEVLIDEGDKVIVEGTNFEGSIQFVVLDVFRLPMVFLSIVIFLLIAVIFAGIKGLSSFLGLIASLIILIGFVVPWILAGKSPVVGTFLGAVAIAFFSLYLAHGFNKRTTLALASTLIAIVIAVLLSILFVELTSLIGIGSEESLFIQSISGGTIDLRGLLLGGIIIGTLGVLDDITTAQTAVVEELKIANNKYNFKMLYASGTSVGREHIASLINTLVLAYAGSSFALFILIVANNTEPLWVTLNSAFIVEEVIRTIVGSSTLILAVPISTALAAYFYQKNIIKPN